MHARASRRLLCFGLYRSGAQRAEHLHCTRSSHMCKYNAGAVYEGIFQVLKCAAACNIALYADSKAMIIRKIYLFLVTVS